MSIIRKLRPSHEKSPSKSQLCCHNEALSTAHGWELQTEFPQISGRSPVEVPDPTTFRNLSLPTLPSADTKNASNVLKTLDAYPDIGHMAVHLCLLECFVKLKEQVMVTDGFDQFLKPSLPTYSDVKSETDNEKSGIHDGEQRWQILLKLALSRYHTWFVSIPKILRHAFVYSAHRTAAATLPELTQDYLPPLDVLLIWYIHMLHPQSYRSDCLEHNHTLLHLGMPWAALSRAINKDTFTYTLSKPASALFRNLSNQAADVLSYAAAPPPYDAVSNDSAQMFSVDLVSSILSDETSFLKKMHSLLWIRSPALGFTLQSAQRAYQEFWVNASSEKPKGPWSIDSRPDIQLAWRTHLLYPQLYALFPDTRTLPPSPLSLLHSSILPSPEETCFCWAHQLLLSSHRPLSSSSLAELKYDLAYHIALEQARRSGKSLPVRAQTTAEKAREAEELRKKEAAGVYVSWIDKERGPRSWTGGSFGWLAGIGA